MDQIYSRVLSGRFGLIPSVRAVINSNPFSDDGTLYWTRSGDLQELYPDLSFRPPGRLALNGWSCAICPELAFRKAVFETLERYATTIYCSQDVISATPVELGSDALDCTRLASYFVKSSDGTWNRHHCDPSKPIRWIKGYNVIEDRTIWVPLCMVHIYAAPNANEDFFPQSTTGVAAHTDLEVAIGSALCEVVERDAVEGIWLTRAPLQELSIDGGAPPDLRRLADQDSVAFVDQRYYDATTDIGVPTVYAVRKLAHPIGNDVIVSCATRGNLYDAALAARLEAGAHQLARAQEAQGESYTRFRREPGVVIQEAVEDRPDLDFLGSGSTRQICDIENAETNLTLPDFVSRVWAGRRDIIVVDLTTDDLRAVGVHVVKAIVPDLLTVGPSARERFLDHPRLAEISAHFGARTLAWSELNQQPQAF